MRKEEVIEKVETIKGTQRNFVLLDLVDNSKQNNSQVIEEWLRNDEFSYFEIDTQVSFV
jgi:protein-arginine kinase